MITRLLNLAPAARPRLAALVVLLLAITATYVGQGVLIAQSLARIFAGRPISSIVWFIAGIAALQLVRSLALAVRESVALRASGAVKAELRRRLTAKLLLLGPSWAQRGRTGSTQTELVDGIETVDAYIGKFLPQTIAALLGAVGVTSFLFVIDPVIGVVVLLCAVLMPVVPLVSKRLLKDRNAAWLRGYKGLYAENLDALQGMATLKAFNASGRRGRELAAIAEAFRRDSIRLMAIVVVYLGGVAFVIGLGTAVALGVGSMRLVAGELSVTELLLVLMLTAECFRPLKELEAAYHSSYSAVPALTAIFEVLDAPVRPQGTKTLSGQTSGQTSERSYDQTYDRTSGHGFGQKFRPEPDLSEDRSGERSGHEPVRLSGNRHGAGPAHGPDHIAGPTSGHSPAQAAGQRHGAASGHGSGNQPRLDVSFDDVTFTYRDRDRPALDRFTLHVAPGERVALVGRSGAGKTTVASLLLRYFDPDRGRITIGGVDIADLPLDELRSHIAVVAQDTYLFHGTVRHNLTLARPDATDDEIEAAIRAASAAFVHDLPQGLDTIVGERGLKLSGGERQRIAIARALLKDAPILILDEATSSVDAANESGIQQALDALTGGRTTIMIAHRLSTVRDADRVIVMSDGRIAEQGDHTTLLDRRGAYARLVAAQEGAA